MLRQRGNILFLILLAVVMFAALAYAVTSSMRGGGKDTSDESASLSASQIMQAGTIMANAVDRMMMINNCNVAQLSFESNSNAGYTNSSTPSDGRCKLFDPNGGGIPSGQVDEKWMDTSLASVEPNYYREWYFYNAVCVSGTGTGGISGCNNNGTHDDNDLVVYLPFVKKSVCMAINDAMGIPRRGTNDVLINSGDVLGFSNSYKYRGWFFGFGSGGTTTFHLSVGTEYRPTFYHRPMGCFEKTSNTSSSTPSGQYVYYAVLLAR